MNVITDFLSELNDKPNITVTELFPGDVPGTRCGGSYYASEVDIIASDAEEICDQLALKVHECINRLHGRKNYPIYPRDIELQITYRKPSIVPVTDSDKTVVRMCVSVIGFASVIRETSNFEARTLCN